MDFRDKWIILSMSNVLARLEIISAKRRLKTFNGIAAWMRANKGTL